MFNNIFSVSPLSVVIKSHIMPVKIGEKLTILCEVKGARPRPVIKWWRDSIRIKEMHSYVSIFYFGALSNFIK